MQLSVLPPKFGKFLPHLLRRNYIKLCRLPLTRVTDETYYYFGPQLEEGFGIFPIKPFSVQLLSEIMKIPTVSCHDFYLIYMVCSQTALYCPACGLSSKRIKPSGLSVIVRYCPLLSPASLIETIKSAKTYQNTTMTRGKLQG